MLLSRLLARSLTHHFKTLTLIPSHSPKFSSRPRFSFFRSLHPFSSNSGNDGSWSFPPDSNNIFGEEGGDLSGITDDANMFSEKPKISPESKKDIDGVDKETLPRIAGGDEEWQTDAGYKPWSLGDEEGNAEKDDVFGGIEGLEGIEEERLDELGDASLEKSDEILELEQKEKELLEILKGPKRAFGDLIEASGITEDMLDSLILLKDARGVRGLPSISETHDDAIARMNETSTRAERERKKQEEIANARVRKVDEKGRAYGTGRRKCSIARVWIEPGDGNFVVNDKQFDAYFPIIDHRAELLRPFTATNTLGLWNISCTVKGGGVSGQVGAIRLGISRALQNWEPGLRPYLKSAGFLTRDSRVVERKKYGLAKARKSYQWVKR